MSTPLSITIRLSSGYQGTKPLAPADRRPDSTFPATMVHPLAHWGRVAAISVLHSPDTPASAVTALLRDAEDALGPLILGKYELPRFYFAAAPGQRAAFPMRRAIAMGYELFSRGTEQENLDQLGYASYEEYVAGHAYDPPSMNHTAPLPTQLGPVCSLDEALASLTPCDPADGALDALYSDPVNRIGDLLYRHDYALPASCAVDIAAAAPGDTVTFTDGTFGLVLADGCLFVPDRGFTDVADAAAREDFAGAFNITRTWPLLGQPYQPQRTSPADRLIESIERNTAVLRASITEAVVRAGQSPLPPEPDPGATSAQVAVTLRRSRFQLAAKYAALSRTFEHAAAERTAARKDAS